MNRFVIWLSVGALVYGCSSNEIKQSTKVHPHEMPKKDTLTEHQKLFIQHNVTVNDTFFFHRITEPYVDIVFIDKNRENEFYQELRLQKQPDVSFIYEYLKSPLRKFNTAALPDEWIELIRVNGNYYVYRPSNDWYNLHQFNISDSLYVGSYSDLAVRALKSFRKETNKRYKLVMTTTSSQPENPDQELIIHVVDQKRHIYLFESRYPGDSPQYYFATPVKSIGAFDLINVYNSKMKTHSDVTPDTIDYPAFIQNL